MSPRTVIRTLSHISERQRPLMFYPTLMIRVEDAGERVFFVPTITEGVEHLLSREGGQLSIWEYPIQSRYSYDGGPPPGKVRPRLGKVCTGGVRLTLSRVGYDVVLDGPFSSMTFAPDNLVADYTQDNPPLNLVGRSKGVPLSVEYDRRT